MLYCHNNLVECFQFAEDQWYLKFNKFFGLYLLVQILLAVVWFMCGKINIFLVHFIKIFFSKNIFDLNVFERFITSAQLLTKVNLIYSYLFCCGFFVVFFFLRRVWFQFDLVKLNTNEEDQIHLSFCFDRQGKEAKRS